MRSQARRAAAPRGTIAAAVATALAVAGHVVAGGHVPSARAVAASFVLAAVACTWLAGRLRGTAAVAACCAAGQLGDHLVFSALPGEGAMPHDGATMPSPAAAAPAMVAGHVLALALTALVVRHAATLARSLRRLVHALVRFPAPPSRVPGGPRRPSADTSTSPRLPGPGWRGQCPPRRGPPRGSAGRAHRGAGRPPRPHRPTPRSIP